MWSTAVDVILTTLRYLAPATLLTIFWGQESFLFKFLKYIDSAFRSFVCSTEEQKEEVLQWLENTGTVRVNKLETVWRHGWIICGLLDQAMPGSCTGHPPTKLSLKHAQSIAEDYLGVEPIFTRQELESIETLGKHQEWKLITFLDNIRLALARVTPTSKQSSIRFATQSTHHTFDYIARGAGLTAAQINNKACFKIYPTAQQSLHPEDVHVVIKGPNKSHGTVTIPVILGKAQIIRQSLLGKNSTTKYTENILPITQGTTYLRTYGKNDMSKTYFIPQMKSNIVIETEVNDDHVKVSYVVKYKGMYEISITSKNLNIAGSPFLVSASDDIVEDLENDSFSLEDGEEIDIVDVTTDRKVVLRIVDFGTEKMLIQQNGSLEKITDDEAKHLMELDNVESIIENNNISSTEVKLEKQIQTENISSTELRVQTKSNALKKFKLVTHKVVIMNRVCKEFNRYRTLLQENKTDRMRNQVDIPDVVNSTFNDYNVKADLVPGKSRFIVPENISVSLQTEKLNEPELLKQSMSNNESKYCDTTYIGPIHENIFDEIELSNSSKIRLSDGLQSQDYATEKKFGSFNTSEYETNNLHTEEQQGETIELDLRESSNLIQHSTNVPEFETNLIGSQCTMTQKEIKKSNLNNKSHDDTVSEQTHSTEYIRGPQVSEPHNNLPTSSKTLDSNDLNIDLCIKEKCTRKDSTHVDEEFESTFTNNNAGSSVNNTKLSKVSPKNDMWDSAYVSIDENNSPDVTLNVIMDERYQKQRLSNIDDLSSINVLEGVINASDKQSYGLRECDRSLKLINELKMSACTPIKEEGDKTEGSEILQTVDYSNQIETDSVTEAFAELDDIYDNYFSNEVDTNIKNETIYIENTNINDTIDGNVVDSASDNGADVKRHTTSPKGAISEIQANVTESASVSRILQTEASNNKKQLDKDNSEIKIFSNIVIERKMYWDEKIRQNEAKAEELKCITKKRLSSKYLRRNDSLTKRRGKKIVQNFLNSDKDVQKDTQKTNVIDKSDPKSSEVAHNKINFKDSIKSYWDNRVQSMESCFGKKSTEDRQISLLSHYVTPNKNMTNEKKDDYKLENTMEMKQELSEKVFEAFETSPKRFFGTSRQQILNKIDNFLGKSENDSDSKSNISDISYDSGLVSSRISLFHNIAKTEPLNNMPYRKHKSLNNISVEKVSINKNFVLNNEHPKPINCDHLQSNIKIGNIVNIDKNANLIKEPIVSFQVEKLDDVEIQRREKSDTETLPNNNTRNINAEEINKNINNFKNTDNQCYNENQDVTTKDTDLTNENIVKHNLKTFSKSEMDIFNKLTITENIELDKHKSFEDLPKVSVKKFISIYEYASKTSEKTKLKDSDKRKSRFHKKVLSESSIGGTANESNFETTHFQNDPTQRKTLKTIFRDKSFENDSGKGSQEFESISNEDKNASCLSLSDIDIEIVEKADAVSEPKVKSETEVEYTEYKNRFIMAKQYFKSLEELRIDKKPKQNLECERINDTVSESPQKNKLKKINIKKSHTVPATEMKRIWDDYQDHKSSTTGTKKLVKISEKFNVEDLYEDVMEGRLSRQGSLRGIPNKKAVLETFRSMENVTGKNFNSYELATSQMSNFTNDNVVRSAQTYLSEYPYLPTTDPSKYHSRYDASASGLITFKELKLRKVRRNSVPDVRINPIYSEEL